MTKLEVVQMIGNNLTKLDVAIGSLLPSDPAHRQLLDLRLLLDDRQRALSIQTFQENSSAFQQATQELSRINDDIRVSIAQVDRLNATIANVTRFVNSVTSLLTTFAAVA